MPSKDVGFSRKNGTNEMSGLIKETIVLIIKFYQSSLGLFLGGQCRFVPSCSEYAIEAVRQFGAVKGTYMAAKRLLKCHPFGSKGYDPPNDYEG